MPQVSAIMPVNTDSQVFIKVHEKGQFTSCFDNHLGGTNLYASWTKKGKIVSHEVVPTSIINLNINGHRQGLPDS